jgi:hypothetical protein
MAFANSKSAFLTVLTALVLAGCSSESTQSKTEDELVLGCKAIQSDFGIKLDEATPHFAKAARMNPEYLVLIDKLSEAKETDSGYRTYKATLAEGWLYRFCSGLEENVG